MYSFEHFELLLNYITEKKIPLLEKNAFTNPLLWELGHVLWFFQKHYIEPLDLEYTDLGKYDYKYDSLVCDIKYRFDELCSFGEILKAFERIKRIVTRTHTKDEYITWVNIMHMHMHLESFYFTLKYIGYDLLQNPTKKVKVEKLNDYLNIPSGAFLQGCNTFTQFSWDNEKPHFNVYINGFSVSKYCVSVYEYKEFVNSENYSNKEYWDYYGFRFIKENNITTPLYWEDQLKFPMRPVCHISLFEAKAYAKWLSEKDGVVYNIPNESEWEYMCKHLKPHTGTMDYHPMENVNDGLQMFGNVWEWCDTRIYPYDGFRIDKLYKEMSYPFFGFKYIIKGGSWCCPSQLATSYYRNAQMPENRIQFIGMRLIKRNDTSAEI
jgi:formylglycine-generating enzyme required for sulfatase activity